MNKEEQIKFLEEVLTETVKQRLVLEVEYNFLTSQVFTSAKENNLVGQQKARQAKQALDLKIRYIQDLIKDIRDGKVQIPSK